MYSVSSRISILFWWIIFSSYDELIEGGFTDGGIISTGLLDNISTGYAPYGSSDQLTQTEANLILCDF